MKSKYQLEAELYQMIKDRQERLKLPGSFGLIQLEVLTDIWDADIDNRELDNETLSTIKPF